MPPAGRISAKTRTNASPMTQKICRRISERRFVNDALVFLQARRLGMSLLSGNVRDFDFLSQLIPNVRVILYRTPMLPS